MNNQKHGLWMMLCCLLPLLAIFLLPGFGVRSNGALLFFVIAMFACHFLMMGGHGGHDHQDKDGNNGDNNTNDNKAKNAGLEKKEEKHGCH